MLTAKIIKEIRSYTSDEWDLLIEEALRGLAKSYFEVKRFAQTGDKGRDLVAFHTSAKFDGAWDNYQCKHYEKPLDPPRACREIAKIIFYTHRKDFSVPSKMLFCAPRDMSQELNDLLGSPSKLKQYIRDHWNSGYSKHIVDNNTVFLGGELLSYFENFDFDIFTSYQTSELIGDHRKTAFWVSRFGGLLPAPPAPIIPSAVQIYEAGYITQLLEVYGEQESCSYSTCDELQAPWRSDFDSQRERYFRAEALGRAYRDETPVGTLDALFDDIHAAVEPVSRVHATDGYERLNRCLSQAAAFTPSGLLSQHANAKVKQGICHHLANDARLRWIPK